MCSYGQRSMCADLLNSYYRTIVTLLPPGPPVFSPWLVPVEVPGPVEDGSLTEALFPLPDAPGPVVLSEPKETVWLLEEAEL